MTNFPADWSSSHTQTQRSIPAELLQVHLWKPVHPKPRPWRETPVAFPKSSCGGRMCRSPPTKIILDLAAPLSLIDHDIFITFPDSLLQRTDGWGGAGFSDLPKWRPWTHIQASGLCCHLKRSALIPTLLELYLWVKSCISIRSLLIKHAKHTFYLKGVQLYLNGWN